MIITLAGFMGCGKSSVGRELRDLLGWRLEDLDDCIEREQGRSIPDIFSSDGEAAFRKMELCALREIAGKGEIDANLILSLGGGTLTTPECAKLVRERTFCVYLKASTDTLVANLTEDGISGRPLLGGASSYAKLKEKVESLMASRTKIYEDTAATIIPIDGLSFREIADRIAETLQKA